MVKNKLTPWFPEHIKPVRTGVYETRAGMYDGYSYWTGMMWCNTGPTPDYAKNFANTDGAIQDKEWRGLKEKAK